jgi:hypothetical protein
MTRAPRTSISLVAHGVLRFTFTRSPTHSSPPLSLANGTALLAAAAGLEHYRAAYAAVGSVRGLDVEVRQPCAPCANDRIVQ